MREPEFHKRKTSRPDLWGNSESICQDYINGLSRDDLVLKYKSNCHTILKILRLNNITKRPLGTLNRQYKLDQNYFEKIDSEEKSYFLGLLYADGCVTDRGVFQISLTLKDSYLLDFFKNKFYIDDKNVLPIKNYQGGFSNGKPYKKLVVYSRKITNDLIKLGCTPRKTFTLQFPTFDQVPEHLMNHFIRGYFDGDGWATFLKKENKLRLGITSSEFFIKSYRDFLVNKLNIKSIKYQKNNKSDPNNHPVRRICFYRINDLYSIYKYIYKNATVFLKRKRDIIENFYLNHFKKEKYPIYQ